MATPIPKNLAAVTPWEAAAACGGRIVHLPDEAVIARGLTTDTRAIEPGCAFVALRGERFDGHTFVDEASKRGACLVIVERGRAPATMGNTAVVEVDDTLVAWGALARHHIRAWRRHRGRNAVVVGITGSAGKTTTKELVALALSTFGSVHATRGNLNNRIGVPSVALGVLPEHRFLVLEMGMSLRGEIEALAKLAEPDVGVITNVGFAHAEGVGGTRQDVAREKGALLAALYPRGVAIVPEEDPAARGELARTRAERVRTFGLGGDYRLASRVLDASKGGARLVIERPGALEPLTLEVPLVGEAQALDLAAAVAAAEESAGSALDGPSLERALRSLSMEGRLTLVFLADGTLVVDDSYNANPHSMKEALKVLSELGRNKRKLAILGEMKELGPVAEPSHDTLGEDIVRAAVDLVVSCGGLMNRALAIPRAQGTETLAFGSSVEAADAAVSFVRPGDVVLVKGSRSIATERVVETLVRTRGLRPSGAR